MSEYPEYTFTVLKVPMEPTGLQPLTETNVNQKDSEEVYELMISDCFAKFKVESWLIRQAEWVAKNGKCENPDEMKNETLVWNDENDALTSISSSSSEESSEDDHVNKKSKQT